MKKVRLKGTAIETILARKNLSQNWLAVKLGISSGYMSQLLAGSRFPSPTLRKKILDRFDDQRFDDLFELLSHGKSE